MEALANRLWQSTVSQDDIQDEEFVDYENEDEIPHPTCISNEPKAIDKEQEEEDILETNDEKEDITFFGSLFDEMIDQEIEEKVKDFEEKNKEIVNQFAERSETTEEMVAESKERESELVREGLPECLLLMMYEPKLSMEVSKETWVSSKDFIRRHSSKKKPPPPPPPSAVKPTDGQSKVSATSTTSSSKYDKHVTTAPSIQPGRSSCSLPAPTSMAEMLEQKLVNAVGYEPFVLTRCKSEPMRTAAAKLAPDNCFWKNRKLEPLRRASFGVGAAGVGF
ncbi:hypothetical protein L1987_26672 [Smallanthus sonchifolius]|uniref:Uncharacterized protein n=1 Tax=Smallanthus sonchifolius TaxID=185202 RepID=A0ACB9I9C9_9ASTR|nr:hypothetical protein L1987_26672 [Smallanthus sonchifolius]